MVTMQQIADRCGVSRGTVDRALHHKMACVRKSQSASARLPVKWVTSPTGWSCSRPANGRLAWCCTHHSMFVRMLCDLFASFSERELIPNVTVIVRSMYDMDIQHQLTD